MCKKMDYFENTTRITEEGYAAILRFKNRQQWIVCRSVSLVLAAPLTGRLAYAISLLAVHSVSQYHFGFLDIFFCILFLGGIWLWHYPKAQIQAYVRRTRNRVDLQAVNQYTFLPDNIRMMTTSSLSKFQLDYAELSWVRSDSKWIVLFFRGQDFTMLVDRSGFTKGTASACLTFLRNKADGQ